MIEPVPLSPLPETPLASILMSNYNYGRFVADAIESVLAQSYPHFELIIADDGSTDDSVQRISEYAKKDIRIRLVVGPNGGQSAAWNRAYTYSSGEIISFLDSDDWFVTGKLERVVAEFQRSPEAGLLVHPILITDMKKRVLRQMPSVPSFDHGWIGPRVVERRGRWQAMPSSAMCLRREVAEVIFPVPEGIMKTDADSFVMRIGPLLSPVTSIDDPLTLYRSHGSNATQTPREQLESLSKREDNRYRTGLAVNQRLRSAQLDDRVIPVEMSRRAAYWISILDGSGFLSRMRLLIPLIVETLKENFDSLPKRLAHVVVYASSSVLPYPLRGALMDRFFSVSSYYHRSRPWQQWSMRFARTPNPAHQYDLKPGGPRDHST